MKEEWKSTLAIVVQCHVVGVQFVMISGDGRMLKLFVDNLVIDQWVSTFN